MYVVGYMYRLGLWPCRERALENNTQVFLSDSAEGVCNEQPTFMTRFSCSRIALRTVCTSWYMGEEHRSHSESSQILDLVIIVEESKGYSIQANESDLLLY